MAWIRYCVAGERLLGTEQAGADGRLDRSLIASTNSCRCCAGRVLLDVHPEGVRLVVVGPAADGDVDDRVRGVGDLLVARRRSTSASRPSWSASASSCWIAAGVIERSRMFGSSGPG